MIRINIFDIHTFLRFDQFKRTLFILAPDCAVLLKKLLLILKHGQSPRLGLAQLRPGPGNRVSKRASMQKFEASQTCFLMRICKIYNFVIYLYVLFPLFLALLEHFSGQIF